MPKGNDKYLYDVFSKAFHEVVAPELEDIRVNMSTKKDVKEVKDTVDNIEARTERIERQLFKINDRLDRHGKTIDNHEKRIGKIAEKPGPRGETSINEIFIPEGFNKIESEIPRNEMVKFWAKIEKYWKELENYLADNPISF